HTLDEAALKEGHCFLHERQLYTRTTKNLGDDTLTDLLPAQLDALRAERRVIVQPLPHGDHHRPAVFSPHLHAAETSTASRPAQPRTARTRLARLGQWRTAPLPLDDREPQLAPAQEAAVRMALSEPFAVLTGGPGCGKSFTVRTVVDVVEEAGGRVALAAPTG